MKQKKQVYTIPSRSSFKTNDKWNLTKLFSSLKGWETTLKTTITSSKKFSKYEGSLKENAKYILKILKEYYAIRETIDKLSAYAILSYYSDVSDTKNQELFAKITNAYPVFSRSSAFFTQELLTLKKTFLQSLVKNKDFADYSQAIRATIRQKPHILSNTEEKLLAEQVEYSSGFSKSFGALIDADITFGVIRTPQGDVELTHATLKILLEHKSRKVRKDAYTLYFSTFNKYINTLTSLYSSNVQKDAAITRIRKYKNTLESHLYEKNLPLSIYTTLINTVRKHLPILHSYYTLMKKITRLSDYSIYDTYYNPFSKPATKIKYTEAVGMLKHALLPLGKDYVDICTRGLLSGRWVDRYECKGKRSGAFSYPVYNAPPYIMMNYKEESIDNVFTLAHEIGHSMHSYFSNQNNSYAHFRYSIFEAEIASTLNEYLLFQHIISTTNKKSEQAFYLLQHIQGFVATFFRQTMFAEFEYAIHTSLEHGIPLTSQLFLSEYEKLSKIYYGKNVTIPSINHITGLRIPHFYSSFYVFQYATGIAAAHAIGKNILKEHKSSGTSPSLKKYMNFLKSGGSQFPLEALSLAGINLLDSSTISHAIQGCKENIAILSKIVKK